MSEFETYCVVCREPIPELRQRHRANTCSKAHGKLLRAAYRRMVDQKRCRSCAKPSTPEQRAGYRAFLRWLRQHPEHPDYKLLRLIPGGGKRGWPKGGKRGADGKLLPAEEAAELAEAAE